MQLEFGSDSFDPVEYLVNLQHFGVKLGLERMQELVALLGHPERKFSSIHVAGTGALGRRISFWP